MINLIRFLLLVSLVAPTAKGQDSVATPLPSPTAPSDELPIAPASPPPVDPLALEPPVVDDLNLKPVDELKPARIVMEIPEPEITAEEVQKLLVSVHGEKDVADRVKVIKENNPLTLELYSPMDQTVRGLIQVRRMDSREQKKANRSSSDTAGVREVKIVYLKNAAAQTVQSIVYDIFGADVTPGVDTRTNSLILSGPVAKLNEALALVDKLDTAEPAPLEIQETQKRASSYMAPREQKTGPAERRVGELLEEHRLSRSRGTGKATIDDEQEKSLREAIAAAFDERQAQQLAEIEELSTRLQELSKTVRGRQVKRQQMIERRLNDVLKSESPEPNELRQPQTLESSFRGVRTEEDLFNRNPVILFFGAGDDEDSIGQIALMHRLQGQGHPVELIDIRDNPNLAARFEIQQIPTVIAVRDGAEMARTIGPTTHKALYSHIVKATHKDPDEEGTERSSNNMEQDTSTESLFQSVMRLSSRAAAIKADLNGETGELRNRPKDDPRAIEVREQLNVGLAQIRAQAAEYQKFVASAANLAKTRLDNARSDLDRRRQLSEQGIVPVSELRKSEEALAEAEAAVQQLTQIQEVLSSITASAEDAQGRAF